MANQTGIQRQIKRTPPAEYPNSTGARQPGVWCVRIRSKPGVGH
jgi:hypothetical protein